MSPLSHVARRPLKPRPKHSKFTKQPVVHSALTNIKPLHKSYGATMTAYAPWLEGGWWMFWQESGITWRDVGRSRGMGKLNLPLWFNKNVTLTPYLFTCTKG